MDEAERRGKALAARILFVGLLVALSGSCGYSLGSKHLREEMDERQRLGYFQGWSQAVRKEPISRNLFPSDEDWERVKESAK